MLYDHIIRPLLFRLSIEQAHRAAILGLRFAGSLPFGRWLLHKYNAVEHPALEREVYGIHFANPVGMAAGFDNDGEVIGELAALGFGFIEIGTLTPRPQEGNPRPRVFRLPGDRATVNRLGLPNHGLEPALARLRALRNAAKAKGKHGPVVGCNIGCNIKTDPDDVPQDYLKLFRNLYQYADYFTVNINCDNGTQESKAPSTARLMQILGPLFDFRRGQNDYRPILMKISPDLTDDEIDRLTDLMIDTPLDGIVAVSGTNRREGLRTSRAALQKAGGGRLGGTPLRERALEVVRRIRQRSEGTYPIIGVGGITEPQDARALLEAGASLVQLYSGLVYEGPRLVRDICRDLIAATEHPTEQPTEQPIEQPAAEAAGEPARDDA